MGHGHDGRAADENLDHFRSLLQEHMVKRGLRSTDQRRLIVETFFQAPNHVSIEELHLEPDPGPQITNFTKRMDLIVLPSPNRRFGDPSVVGTPSWQVVRTAECPVLTVMATAFRCSEHLAGLRVEG